MTSGLEGEVLRSCDYERMDKTIMNLARRVLGGLSVYEHEGKKRQHCNERVRVLLGLTCVKDMLGIRRLGWLLDILAHPSENVQLRAALGGKLQLGSGEELADELCCGKTF